MDDTQNVFTAMKEYERLYLSLQPSLDKLERLKETIKTLVLQERNTVSRGRVKATYKKGYKRVFQDSEGLDGYVITDPEVRYLHEPSVSVSVAKA